MKRAYGYRSNSLRGNGKKRWRRERDSNPRCRYKRHTRFPVVLLQPTRTSLRMVETCQHRCWERLPRIFLIKNPENWRRGWDSNPRSRVNGIPLFESGAFSHSATSPHPDPTPNALLELRFIPCLKRGVNGLIRAIPYRLNHQSIHWCSFSCYQYFEDRNC